MEAVAVPLPPDTWDALPAEARGLILALQAQVVVLQAEVAALQAQCRELHASLGQDASNSSRPPSSEPPQAAKSRTRRSPASGRTRGGQRGHPGRFRELLPVEQVDEVVVAIPEHCRRCQRPFPGAGVRHHGRPWRHQVVELLPLAVRVTE